MRHAARTTIALCSAVGLLAGACGSDDDTPDASGGTAAGATSGATVVEEGGAELDADSDLSIVVLGDSVASGEGIDYGYSYDKETQRWTGGTDDPTWAGDFPLCHQSEQAYGNVVAEALGATLATFACTGSTYENGIVGARTSGSGPVQQEYRPAQFGTWPGGPLNEDYDAAEPDVVVVTLGADDLSFVPVVTYCVTGIDPGEQAAEGSPPPSVPEPDGTPDATDASGPVCTEANPGAAVQRLFDDQLPVLEGHYGDLVSAIQARGEAAGKVPHIVFTTYHDPLPTAGERCPDLLDLSPDQVSFLRGLVDRLNTAVVDTVGDLDGVSVADIAKTMDGHTWCSDEPWAYGMSALYLNPSTQAPFHPTADGQAAIAEVVRQTIEDAR